MRRRPRPTRQPRGITAWTVVSLLAMSGCAARLPSPAPLPGRGADPRQEIAQLEQSIEERRALLGLPGRHRTPTVAELSADDARDESPPRPAFEPARKLPAAPKADRAAGAASAPPAAEPPPAKKLESLAERAPPPDTASSARPPAPVTPAPPPPPPPPPSAGSAKTVQVTSRREATSERCRHVVQAADEICEAADRICRLASDLREPAADRACSTARLDCSEARDAAMPCL